MSAHPRRQFRVLTVVLPAFFLGIGMLYAAPQTGLFTTGAVLEIQITIATNNLEVLRQSPRTPVHAVIREGDTVYEDVSVHLKGAKGSFRSIDDKPALTLEFSRHAPGRKFHGLRKLHLNNSVEDPSFLNEQLGGEIFRATGIPAPRVTHAHVALNSHPLGLYVVTEGFSEDFLAGYFQKIGPDLYEPEYGGDIDSRMKRNSVNTTSPEDGEPLNRLVKACSIPDLVARWVELQKTLDVDQFLSFIALEVMLCHRDGYSIARNNYRVYHNVETGKMVFFPHGMDQLLGKSDFPWEPAMAGTVAKALMETPEGRSRYEALFPQLMTNHLQPAVLTNRVDELVQQLRPSLQGDEYQLIQREAQILKKQIVARRADLERQLAAPKVKELVLTGRMAHLSGWLPAEVPDNGKIEQIKSADGKTELHILAGPKTMASWRTKWLIPRGHYRFEGQARTANAKPLPSGIHHGARLRTSAADRQSDDLIESVSWRKLESEFQVDTPIKEVEFICEFRASAGEAWFDLDSIKLIQIE